MSVNPTTNEDPSENLDLNSDAAPLSEQDKICSARVTESTFTVTASVVETLTEDHSNGNGQAEGPPPEGGSNGLGACGEGENLVEPLLQASEARHEGTNSHGAEEYMKEAASPVILLKETITETTVEKIQVETLTEEPSDGQVPVEDSHHEGKFNGHGVCGEEGNAVQALAMGSDVCVDGKDIHGADDSLNEEVGHSGPVNEDLEKEMKSVDAGIDQEENVNSNEKVGTTNSVKEDLEREMKSVTAVIDQEGDGKCSPFDAEVGKMEPTVEQIQSVDEGTEPVVKNPDFFEPKDSDLERNPSLELEGYREEKNVRDADPLVSFKSFMSADDNRPPPGRSSGSCEESSSMQDNLLDTDDQVAPSKLSEVGGSQAVVSDASLHGKVEVDFDQVTDPGEPWPEGNLQTEAQLAGVCISTLEDQSVCQPFSEQGSHVMENQAMEVEVETQVVVGSSIQDENQKIEIAGQGTSVEQQEKMEETAPNQQGLNHGNTSIEDNCTVYDSPPEEDGVFSVSDLVWGKVKSHPWWPGQIFDPSDSSEKAMKYRKKDSFLVAYFGDQTFAWNEASLLKHFHTHFSEMETQNNSVAFRTAVNSALDEVSRRVELGMACSCTSEEVYAKIKSQIIENAGIREESSKRGGVDRFLSASSFEPQKLVEYIRALALSPLGGVDRLELVIAQAQLLALCRLKGFTRLPEFQLCGRLLENDTESLLAGESKHSEEVAQHLTPVYFNDEENMFSGKGKLSSQGNSSRKRRNISQERPYHRKKERSLSELMDGKEDSSNVVIDGNESDRKSASKLALSSSGKKRKAFDSPSDNLRVENGKRNLSSPRAAAAETPNHKQSFKIGDCIRRVASKLTGSPPILKCNSQSLRKSAVKVGQNTEKPDRIGISVSPRTPELPKKGGVNRTEYPSTGEMLSQLFLAARDPVKGYSFLTVIVSFFSDYRNSVIIYKRGSGKHKKSSEKVSSGRTDDRNKEPPTSDADSAEAFDFDEDVKDSYWTDRIVHISTEEQPSKKGRRRKGAQIENLTKSDMLIAESENSLQLSPMLDPKQQSSDGFYELTMDKPLEIVEAKYEEEFSPTALILNFTEVDSIPSEMSLNKIFKRFGPLKESETEVLRETSCAQVVFKRCADAEVACSSAGKFGIFGPVFVSYQLRYLSSSPAKTPVSTTRRCRRAAISTGGNQT
ncbi:PREDICTED: uncharacterized protein LOC104588661 [Nelumbo nucifera]|uniref:Uncharacterized protein LOC104588661 n=1 Tax=Nelumbo nucifera TaxID=4432 RepID=A0A1U7ZB32_NELNU|nr:PREDICTED: uncharacterized protein LOC104588661 [Nelumbo nucifera]XP_010244985.1 PREDICTED: uncharacterized protein LOC104588661 [Nelumbo nucifera]